MHSKYYRKILPQALKVKEKNKFFILIKQNTK